MWSGIYVLVIAFLSILAASGMSGWQQALFLVLSVAAGGASLARKRYPQVLLLLAWVATLFATHLLLVPALFNVGARGRGNLNLLALVLTIFLLAAVSPRGEWLISVDGVELEIWSNVGSWILNVIVVAVVPYLIGQAMATRRDLVESYRMRAEHAEAERSARAAESVLLERARIAREAHDVLGHKLSLLALQAGGLKLNAHAGAHVIEKQAQLIQKSARDALEDLRSIISSVEVPGGFDMEGSDRSLAPRGVFGIQKLVEKSIASGAIVNLATSELFPSERLPEDISRAAYRVVQECLTNAHVHAPGAPVVVSLSGSPGGNFVVEVRNTVTVLEGDDGPRHRGGRGLPGLKERVRTVGGALTAGETDSVFIVRAQIPWREKENKKTEIRHDTNTDCR